MKILILSFYHPPDLCAGSFRISAYLSSLKEKLPGDAVVDVITTMPNRYHSYSRTARAVETDGQIRIHRIRLPDHKSGFLDQAKAFGVFFLATLGRIRTEQYDVVFATSSRLFTAFLGAIVARQQKAPLFLDIRDIFTDTMKSLLSPVKWAALSPLFTLIERFTISSAGRVNLVSEGFAPYFKARTRKVPFSFYTNGIDDDFLGISFAKRTDTGKKIITYAGNIGQGQGLENIIPGMARKLGDGFEIRIVGDGGMRKKLSDLLAQEGSTNVRLMDPVNRSALIRLYRDSDYLFLHLNDYPAFKKVLPSKIFEYGATGKPVLAGVRGYSRAFIRENLTGAMVFDPCDPGDFYEKFKAFDPAPDSRQAFINRFSRRAIMAGMTDEFLRFAGTGRT